MCRNRMYQSLSEVLPIAIRGVDPQGIALHEDGEPISTCPVCGEVNKLWANVAFHGKLCPMPSRRDCACVRARNEREKRAKEARARRQSLAAVFSPEVVPVDYEGTKLDGWGDINANIGFLGRRVLKFYDEDKIYRYLDDAPEGTPDTSADQSRWPSLSQPRKIRSCLHRHHPEYR